MVRCFLGNKGVADLYRSGMTREDAEKAARADPRVVESSVRCFLGNQGVADLYRSGMTIEDAEKARS